MSVKISELPLLSDLADNDVLAGVDTSANATKKIELTTLKNYIDTNTTYTAGTNIDITDNVVSAPNVYNKDEMDSQIEELQSEVDSLNTIYNAFPTTSGEGESVSLDGTAETKFKNITLKGNTSQNGTPTPSSPIPVNVVSGDNEINIVSNMFDLTNGVLNNTTKGIYTYDESDNSFTLGINATGNYVYTEFLCGKICDDNITVSFDFTSITGANVTNWWYRITNSENYDDLVFASSEYSNMNRTFDVSSYKGKYLWIVIRNNTNSSVLYSAKFSNFMVNSGTTALPYTPHKGATYPINLPVENLLGLQDVAETTINGLTYSVSDEEITINGTSTSSGGIVFPIKSNIPTTSGTNYTLSASIEGTLSGGNIAFQLRSNNTAIKEVQSNNVPITYNDLSSTINDFRMYIASGRTFTNYKIKIQLEQGTKVDSYTPYGTTPIELCKIGDYEDVFMKTSGKNLVNSVETHKGINGSTGAITTENAYLGIDDYIPCKPSTTYTITFEHDVSSGTLYIGYKTQNGTYIERVSNGTSRTFTTPSNAYYMIAYSYYAQGFNTIGGYVMLNEGTTALPYEPYNDGSWYLKKEIGEIIFTGEESWTKTGTQGYYNNGAVFNIFHPESSSYIYGYCNKVSRLQNGFLDGQYIGHVNIDKGIEFRNTNDNWGFTGSDATTFKTWLATQNIRIRYVMKTPTNTEITYQPLIEQLNNLEKAMSYNGQTNISQVNNDAPFIISAEAIMSLQNVLDRIELLES